MEAELMAGVGGVVGAGGLGLFMIKHWISKVDERLDRIVGDIQQIKIEMASRKGVIDGQDELIWRDLNSHKISLANIDKKVDKAWETISQMASPRISDLLKESIKEEK